MPYPIPVAALDDRLAFVGTAGAGKTNAAAAGVECVLDQGARVVVTDPLDVWWGLRLSADGERPSRYRPVIFGGAHGDLPINEHAGALIGETVATMAESCIVSLGSLGTKSAERRFMLGFLAALYRHTNGEPVHLIFDEADMWAPQRLLDKEGDAAKLLGQMETIVRRGRIKGFIPWLITQRPAVLSKDVLSQADGLIALKLTASQDRDAIGGWIEGQGDKQDGKRLLASLPSMQRGQGALWIPARGILETVQFPLKRTFDSSRTPRRGEERHRADLKPIDISTLKGKLATVEQEARANDPKALRAELARLNDQMRRAAATAAQTNARPDPQALTDAEHRGYSRGKIEGYADALKLAEPFLPKLRQIGATATELAQGIEQWSHRKPQPVQSPRPVASVRPPAPPRQQDAVDRAGEPLAKGERAVLIVVAQYPDGVTREQLTVLTGYKRSTRDAYIQRLREKDYIALSGEKVTGTDVGIAALGSHYESLPTGAELRDHWLRRLPEGERRVLEVLVAEYPAAVPRETISECTGYKRSTRDAYVQRLKSRMLIATSGDGVSASDTLFDGAA